MPLRILISGLTFFAAAVALAALPVIAQGSSKTSDRPCTITGTSASESLLGTSRADVICGGGDTIFASGGNDIVRGGPAPIACRAAAAGHHPRWPGPRPHLRL